jgi:hypothetical protein
MSIFMRENATGDTFQIPVLENQDADMSLFVVFGAGDISVEGGMALNEHRPDEIAAGVVFRQLAKPMPIGTIDREEAGESHYGPLHMIFKNTESMDVVINALVSARKLMAKDDQEEK